MAVGVAVDEKAGNDPPKDSEAKVAVVATNFLIVGNTTAWEQARQQQRRVTTPFMMNLAEKWKRRNKPSWLHLTNLVNPF